MSAPNRRIAVFFPGALGDFICLLPALHALGKDARIDVYAKSEFADLVAENLLVHTLERHEISRLFVAGGAGEPRVREFLSPYDAIYSWMASKQPVFAAEMEAAAPGRARLFAFRGPDSPMLQVDYYLSCLGFTRDQSQPAAIPLRSGALRWREEYWNRYGLNHKPVLIVAPGSGAREKNWPVNYFAAVARWWRERTCGEVIVLSGPVEEDRGGIDSMAKECVFARNLSLAQVVALLCGGDAYLGNDSGITQLAAFLGLPTAAIFGPTDAQRWAPNGPQALIVRRSVSCSPCNPEVMKRCPHRECLTGLSPGAVAEQLENLAGVATLTRQRPESKVLSVGPANSVTGIADS